jgi:hypothetical protein
MRPEGLGNLIKIIHLIGSRTRDLGKPIIKSRSPVGAAQETSFTRSECPSITRGCICQAPPHFSSSHLTWPVCCSGLVSSCPRRTLVPRWDKYNTQTCRPQSYSTAHLAACHTTAQLPAWLSSAPPQHQPFSTCRSTRPVVFNLGGV